MILLEEKPFRRPTPKFPRLTIWPEAHALPLLLRVGSLHFEVNSWVHV